MPVIDLDRFTDGGKVRNLAGKDRGEAARAALDMENLDSGPRVTVNVPDYLYAISSSYFLGLFSGSVGKFGTKEKFLQHYHFVADASIMKQVFHSVDRCLMQRN